MSQIGAYGSGFNRPHTEDELAKARQALSLLKAHKERGETAAQRIGSYIMGSDSKYKKGPSSTAYEPKGGAGNSNYRKVFRPPDSPQEEDKYSGPSPAASKSRLQKVNAKFNGGSGPAEPRAMSNLANLGRKALGAMHATDKPVSNEFGTRPPVPAPQRREPRKAPSAHVPPQRRPMPVPVGREEEEAPAAVPGEEGGDEDRPIKPTGGMSKGPDMGPDAESAGDMAECQYCGRKFNPDTLTRHEGVCLQRPDKKKRKVFNSKAARLVSEEQKKLAKERRAEPKAMPAKKIPKWKLQSAQFRNAMKSTAPNGTDGGDASDLPPEMDERAGYVQCPTCGRSFNDEAAKRHMPFCANKAKLDVFKSGGQKGRAPPKGAKKR